MKCHWSINIFTESGFISHMVWSGAKTWCYFWTRVRGMVFAWVAIHFFFSLALHWADTQHPLERGSNFPEFSLSQISAQKRPIVCSNDWSLSSKSLFFSLSMRQLPTILANPWKTSPNWGNRKMNFSLFLQTSFPFSVLRLSNIRFILLWQHEYSGSHSHLYLKKMCVGWNRTSETCFLGIFAAVHAFLPSC